MGPLTLHNFCTKLKYFSIEPWAVLFLLSIYCWCVITGVSFFFVRLCGPDDGYQRGQRHFLSDLRCGEATSLYRRHWRHLLAGPHDIQRVALPPPQEEKWPQQHLHRHPQGCVFPCFCVCARVLERQIDVWNAHVMCVNFYGYIWRSLWGSSRDMLPAH